MNLRVDIQTKVRFDSETGERLEDRRVWVEDSSQPLHTSIALLNTGLSDIEQAQYAHLFAAAPYMLGTLEEILEKLEDQVDVVDGPDGQPRPNDIMQVVQLCREAIRKATYVPPSQPAAQDAVEVAV